MTVDAQGRTLDKRDGEPHWERQGGRNGGLSLERRAVSQVERTAIDKLNGKVAYAVMSFGGFGVSRGLHPRPGRSDLQSAARLWVNIGERSRARRNTPKHEVGLERRNARKVYD